MEAADTDAPKIKRTPRPSPARPITVTVADAKRLSGLGGTLLYQRIGTGELESVMVGKRRLIVYASLERLLGTRRQAPAMSGLAERDRERLISVLEPLGSPVAGERDAAAYAAMRLLRSRGWRSADLIVKVADRDKGAPTADRRPTTTLFAPSTTGRAAGAARRANGIQSAIRCGLGSATKRI